MRSGHRKPYYYRTIITWEKAVNQHGDLTYYIRYQFQGTDIKERVGRKSRGFNRETAKEALKSRLGDIARGQFSLEKTRKPVPFSKLVERYREYAVGYKRAWDEEKYILEMFAKEFGGTHLSQITTWQIEKWKSDRRKDVKPGTVNRQLTVIKHMLKMAVEWELTTVNPAAPVKRLPVDDQRTRFLTEDEIQDLLKACEEQITSPWLLPLVTLALNTGARQGELLGLRYEDIDQEQGLIYFGRTKNRRLKTVPMNDAVTEAIDWLLEHRYGDYLFMWPWSDIIGKSTVYDAFKKACGDAQMERFSDEARTRIENR